MNKQEEGKTFPAVKIMYVIHSVFEDAVPNNKDYANSKTNNFLRRCGVDINKPKEQLLDIKRIRDVVYSMLDADSESKFWARLNTINQ